MFEKIEYLFFFRDPELIGKSYLPRKLILIVSILIEH